MILPILLIIFILLLVFIVYDESNQAVFFIIIVTAFAALITFMPPLSKVLQNEKGVHLWKHIAFYALIIIIIITYVVYSWYESTKEIAVKHSSLTCIQNVGSPNTYTCTAHKPNNGSLISTINENLGNNSNVSDMSVNIETPSANK